MSRKMNKTQLSLELEQAQKRIAELEQITEQVKKQGGEAFYHAFIEQINDGIVVLDELGNVVVWNSAQEDIAGIPREEVIGQKYWKVQYRLLTPETRARLTPEQIKDTLQNTFKTGEHPGLGKLREVEIQLAEGKRKIIQISPFKLKTEDGYRIGSITRDITEQRRAVDASRENEERFSHVFHASPAQMAITDANTGKYVDVNTSFLRSLGFAREEVIDKTATELNLFFDPNQRAALLGKMKEQGYLRGEDVLVRTKTGELRHGVFSAEFIQVQEHQFLLTVMNDITERKQMEETLYKNQQTLLETQKIAKLRSWTVDYQTGILNIGPGYDHILEWPEGAYKLESLRTLIHPKDREYVEKSWSQTKENQLLDIEYRILTNGELKWVHTKTNSTVNDGEKSGPISGFSQDVTERKQAETLTYAQRNLARLVSTTISLEDALPQCLNTELDVSGMDCGGIYLFDSHRQSLDLAYHQGLGNGFIQEVSTYKADAPNVQMILAGMMFYFGEADLRSQNTYQEEDLRSLAVIPILDHGHTLGCINIGSHTLDQIPEIARRAIEVITVEVGAVIAHLQTEALLRASEEKYRSLINSQESAIFTVDMDGVFHYMNQIGAAQLAASPDKIIGKTLHDLLPLQTANWLLNHVRMVISIGQGMVTEHQNTAENKLSWQRVSIQPIRNADEKVKLSVVNSLDITERKQAENALALSEKKLQSLIASQTHFVIRINMEGKYIYWNPQFEKEFGWIHHPEGLQNANSIKTVCAHHHQRVIDVVQECVSQPGQVFSVELDKPARNGGVRTTLWEFICITDENNQPSEIQCMGVEITDRKKAEKALSESEEKYRLLAENISDVIWIMDIKSLRFSYVSPSVLQLRGYSADEVLAQDVSANLTPASGQYLAKVIPERLVEFEQGIIRVYTDEFEQPCKDGSIVWTESTTRFVKDPETGKLEVYGVSRNITDRKKAEAAIHMIEKRNTALIEHAPDGIALVDGDGLFLFVSPSAYRMLGHNEGEIIGTQSRGKVHPQDVHLLKNLRNKIQSRPDESQTIEYRFLHKDGSYHWLESTYTNMFSEPSINGIVVNFRDVTDRKLTEEITRQQSEQLQLLYEASQRLNRTLDVKEIYQTICDFMAIIAPSDTLFISAFDHETQLITCSAYWMSGTWLDVAPFPAIPLEEEGKGTQSRVIHSGQPMLLNDYQSFMKTSQKVYYVDDETNKVTNEGPEEDDEDVTRSAMIVPLKTGGVVKGVIQVSSYHLDAYTSDQLKLLEALSLHIASAEQNAMLYTKMLNELNERKQAEIALRNSEEKYRVLIESFDNVIVSIDRQGVILYMNEVAAKRMGGIAKEMIGKTMVELFPEEVVSEQLQHIEQVFNEDKGVVYDTVIMIQGKPRWYSASIQPIHDEDGVIQQVLVNSYDIHDLKTSQQKLEELNRTLEERVNQRTAEVQDLYNNAPAGYHSLDANGNILLINQTELSWLGYSLEEVLGHSILNLFSPDSIATFRENFPAFKERGWLRDLELELVRKDGSLIPILVNATAVYDEQGNYTMSRSTVLDNTDHKAADEALRNANLELARAMRMKDEFLASMSHELRTPLNGILGLSEALQLDVYGPLNEKQKTTLGHVEDSGRHLLELINDILDVSKIEAGKFELEMLPCSLGDICQSSIHLTKGMAGKKHQKVNFTMNPASININADARRLKQVLVNLLSNAVKFTPENGSLGLEVTKTDADNIVHISVWDNGIGISAEDIKKLFQPFVQLDSSLSRQQTGTGLGLTLVQRLVEMHGGSIEIQSAPEQGSRFTVALPCLPENSTEENFNNKFQSKFHYALIVEDETMDASHLARYCKTLGINPILHPTGQGALERAIATRPNIVFLDLNLPDISGWDVLTQLKSNPETKHIPVVITSVEDEKQKASQLDVDGYLVKFFGISDLRAMLIAIQKASSTDKVPPQAASQPTATVMIVDDNEINIETIVDYLSAKNFNVVSAQSGVDFLTRVTHIRPDIILMDIQMPEMDGLETTRRLRAMTDQRLASVPVIALTALAMPGDREICLEAGADEYVTKPFRLKEIQDLILQMLEDKKRIM